VVITVSEGSVTGGSVTGGRAGTLARPSAAAAQWTAPDTRRLLQLVVAAIWLLDGVLQYQSFMFTRGFSQMLAGTAAGNPGVIAHPITWAAGIVAQHPAGTNAAFATIQLLLGLGIAFRPTVRPALAASIVWSVAVWWFGEGLGGVLNGGASPVNGAPGAVILYALLAVLLWPAAGNTRAPFVAARPIGVRTAQALWLVLWGSLAYFSVTTANRTAQGLHDMVAGMTGGEPGWLAGIGRGGASVVAHNGLAWSIVLAVLLAAIAVGVFGPVPALRAAVVLAIVVSLVIWVVGQELGGILAGGATDVNSGPLLVLIALAYWPSRPAAVPRPAAASAASSEAAA
jgi:hypothetical protein